MFIRARQYTNIGGYVVQYFEALESYRDNDGKPKHRRIAKWKYATTLAEALDDCARDRKSAISLPLSHGLPINKKLLAAIDAQIELLKQVDAALPGWKFAGASPVTFVYSPEKKATCDKAKTCYFAHECNFVECIVKSNCG